MHHHLGVRVSPLLFGDVFGQYAHVRGAVSTVEDDLPVICSEWGIATWHFSNGVIPEQAVRDYINVMNYYETGWWTWWLLRCIRVLILMK